MNLFRTKIKLRWRFRGRTALIEREAVPEELKQILRSLGYLQ
ncbi:MAG: hypothetical protein M5R36_23940 [Deltaproteobacteria bacterium]|nr:hypothetical protein [Deltaproteobacteria bacterium]